MLQVLPQSFLLLPATFDLVSLFRGCRSEAREHLGHKLGVLAHTTHFVLLSRAEPLPQQYRLANRLDITLFKPFLFEVVPSGEVAYLEDGWVDSGYLQCKTGQGLCLPIDTPLLSRVQTTPSISAYFACYNSLQCPGLPTSQDLVDCI